jgi:signal transduction histidine kinase/response regulator RpfG family c-di-GMP phosphodiesterase
MFDFVRKSLANKVTVTVVIVIILIMSVEIYLRIYFGTRDRIELMTMLAKEVAASTHAGIKHPMRVGDKDGVKTTLIDITERTKDVDVYIFDFNQEISYSTQEELVTKKVEDEIKNEVILSNLTEILKTGVETPRAFEDAVSERRYLVTMFPILNHEDCYHCHGSSRKVIGGMIVRVSAERVYATVAAQRNRTILITLLGLSIAIILIYLMLNKLVRRPVETLAEKAERFAEGDMSAAVEVKTQDEIGVLGKTFNYMVESVSSTNKKLEEEIERKTSLLNEITRLLTLLEAANRDLRELDKLKSTFLANMSHELRTPMNSIIGYTDLLLDRVDGPVNEEQEKSLGKIAANARHLLQLINDVLDISKIESGKMKLSAKEIDIKWLIDSALPAFEPLIKQKKLSLAIDIAEGMPLLYGDEDKIRQILINLLSNAIKFTNEGRITISATVSERGIKPGKEPIFAEICVEDTGVGIKEEDTGKVFDKFVQVDLTAIRQYEGSGLGLSIARGLVALHKGMIWVTSKYGEGSKFCFTVPIRKEILEKPTEPVIEPRMAEGLADYFGVPVETLLKEPVCAGKPIRCWEYVRCGQPSCPAYGSKESRCWLILGTHCAGMKIGAYPEKVDFCKGCALIKTLITCPEKEYEGLEVEPARKGVERKTILAIDDNPEAIDIIRKYLGDEYSVVGLLSGEQAVEKVKELKPLAITLDIMMPRKDGWQVLRELKSTPETQDIPVVILTIVDDPRLGFSLGAAEYLIKPVEKHILLRKLKNLEKMRKIKRVLIVDDEIEAVRLMGNVLKEAEYQVTTAYNSKDGIVLIHDFKPDLIVLNPTAPEVGFDVVEYMKKREDLKDIPMIIITRKDLSEEEIDELNGRIQGILNKGILTKEDLLNELKDTISKVNKLL